MSHRYWIFTGAFVVAGLAAQPVVAATEPAPLVFDSADIISGKQAAQAEDWKAAITAFKRAVAREPNNADAHNFLAFSFRRSGDLDNAFKSYGEALRLDPKHRGAHEYIGEAYLTAGNLPKAEEHLKILDDLCFFGCSEYNDLKKAIADYKAKPR